MLLFNNKIWKMLHKIGVRNSRWHPFSNLLSATHPLLSMSTLTAKWEWRFPREPTMLWVPLTWMFENSIIRHPFSMWKSGVNSREVLLSLHQDYCSTTVNTIKSIRNLLQYRTLNHIQIFTLSISLTADNNCRHVYRHAVIECILPTMRKSDKIAQMKCIRIQKRHFQVRVLVVISHDTLKCVLWIPPRN